MFPKEREKQSYECLKIKMPSPTLVKEVFLEGTGHER